MNDAIPFVTICAELGADPRGLTARLGDAIFVDETSHLRVVSAATCRRLVDEKTARDAAKRAQIQAAAAEKARRPDPMHQRVAALRERAEAVHRSGDSGMSAFEMMAAADEADRLDRVPSYRLDKLLRGESFGARLAPQMSQEE